jgi:hypothetical protein
MTGKRDDRYGVPPLRQGKRERVLLPGGTEQLSLAKMEKRCLSALTRALAATCLWPAGGPGAAWRIGDFNILIVETTMSPDAGLYVQFWSEPGQPVCCEVCSGHYNEEAKAFIPDAAGRQLAALGFSIPKGGGNYSAKRGIVNRGDAAAVARETLAIFHDVLGYRGLTPLVARAIRGARHGRAVVHNRLTTGDVATLLGSLGYQTSVARKGKRPVLSGRRGEFTFTASLDAPTSLGGEFRCVDLTTAVGHIGEGSPAAWGDALNRLNGLSRLARGWVDPRGNICVGASLHLVGGMTEDEMMATIGAWRQAADGLRGAGFRRVPGRRVGQEPGELDVDEPDGEGSGAPRSRVVVH